MTETAISLVHFDRAREALAIATTVDEVKAIRDQALAMATYLKQRDASHEMQNQCGAIRLRAERRIGEMLARQEKATGVILAGRDTFGGTIVIPPKEPIPTLADQGISKQQSSRWQRIAAIPEEKFEAVLSEMQTGADSEVTTAKMVQVAARLRVPVQAEATPIPKQRFRCLVIDPPWPMKKIERVERPNQGEELDYPVMTEEAILALPIPDLADSSGCHVYLWVTHKFLPLGLRCFETWGVRYQCVMTWVKNVGITPFSWMYSTEHVLFGRVGALDLLQLGLRLDFSAATTRHSEKPEAFYERVIAASPEPRLEMFARSHREGFMAWGNEVT